MYFLVCKYVGLIQKEVADTGHSLFEEAHTGLEAHETSKYETINSVYTNQIASFGLIYAAISAFLIISKERNSIRVLLYISIKLQKPT